MFRVALVLVPVLAAACGPGGIEPDTGADPVDTASDPSGLEVRWTAPDIGARVGPVRFERLRLELRDLRVIGDAAPGATYLAAQAIDLDDEGLPQVTTFDDAPPGRYSAFEFSIEPYLDGERAWELRGEVEIDGEDYDFEIEDEMSSSISLPFAPDLMLSAGEIGVITVEIDLPTIVEGIDWNAERPGGDGGGSISIDDDSPQLPGLRQRLRAAIRVVSIGVE